MFNLQVTQVRDAVPMSKQEFDFAGGLTNPGQSSQGKNSFVQNNSKPPMVGNPGLKTQKSLRHDQQNSTMNNDSRLTINSQNNMGGGAVRDHNRLYELENALSSQTRQRSSNQRRNDNSLSRPALSMSQAGLTAIGQNPLTSTRSGSQALATIGQPSYQVSQSSTKHLNGDNSMKGQQPSLFGPPSQNYQKQQTIWGKNQKPPVNVKRQNSGFKKPASGNQSLNLGKANARKQQSSNVESNISNNILQPLSQITTERIEDNTEEKPMDDEWTLFPKQKQPEPRLPPKQPNDSQWQKQFINFGNGWNKDESAVARNKRQNGKGKPVIGQREAGSSANKHQQIDKENKDLQDALVGGLSLIQEQSEIKESGTGQKQQAGEIDLKMIQEYNRKKQYYMRRQKEAEQRQVHSAQSSRQGQQQQVGGPPQQNGPGTIPQTPPSPSLIPNIKTNKVGRTMLGQTKPAHESESRFAGAIQRMKMMQQFQQKQRQQQMQQK